MFSFAAYAFSLPVYNASNSVKKHKYARYSNVEIYTELAAPSAAYFKGLEL